MCDLTWSTLLPHLQVILTRLEFYKNLFRPAFSHWWKTGKRGSDVTCAGPSIDLTADKSACLSTLQRTWQASRFLFVTSFYFVWICTHRYDEPSHQIGNECLDRPTRINNTIYPLNRIRTKPKNMLMNLQLVREDETLSYKKLLAKSKVVISTQPVQISLSGRVRAWTRKVIHQVKCLHYLAFKSSYLLRDLITLLETFYSSLHVSSNSQWDAEPFVPRTL